MMVLTLKKKEISIQAKDAAELVTLSEICELAAQYQDYIAFQDGLVITIVYNGNGFSDKGCMRAHFYNCKASISEVAQEEKATTNRPTFEDCDRASVASGERNDCFVKAVSICFNKPYAESLRVVNSLGRVKGKGTPWSIVRETMTKLAPGRSIIAIDSEGYRETEYDVTSTEPLFHQFKYDGNRGKTIKSFAARNPIGVFMVFTRGHATAIVDGVIQDWVTDRRGMMKRPFLAFRIG